MGPCRSGWTAPDRVVRTSASDAWHGGPGLQSPTRREHCEAGDDEGEAEAGDDASFSAGHRQAVPRGTDRGRLHLVPEGADARSSEGSAPDNSGSRELPVDVEVVSSTDAVVLAASVEAGESVGAGARVSSVTPSS